MNKQRAANTTDDFQTNSRGYYRKNGIWRVKSARAAAVGKPDPIVEQLTVKNPLAIKFLETKVEQTGLEVKDVFLMYLQQDMYKQQNQMSEKVEEPA